MSNALSPVAADLAALRSDVARLSGCTSSDVRVVRAPYRFCPIGAHLDHQDGEVTGFALDRALYMAFVPTLDDTVTLTSHDLPGEVCFRIDDVPDAVAGDWGNYARGAVRALSTHTALSSSVSLRRGVTGVVAGEMSPGGVSTSAALGVACLLALEHANDLDVTHDENVALDQAIENDYLGLKNGILDQSVVLHAKADSLLHLDCRTRAVSLHPKPLEMAPFALLAVFSGVEESLVSTGYNQRVDECRSAAAKLLTAADRKRPSTSVLRDVDPELFGDHFDALTENERRRAAHYFSEMQRVGDGLTAWDAGDLNRFGTIVTQTGLSSIENYECGSPELIRLYELLAAETGVYGARFSGAGFRGYCVALVDPAESAAIGERVREAYLREYPQHAPAVHAHACRWGGGAGLLPPEGP